MYSRGERTAGPYCVHMVAEDDDAAAVGDDAGEEAHMGDDAADEEFEVGDDVGDE